MEASFSLRLKPDTFLNINGFINILLYFRDLTSLEVLFLDGNGIKIIMDGSLEHLKNLRILDLADNCLLEMPGKLPESLIQLHLENNTIESMAIERIANLVITSINFFIILEYHLLLTT